MALTPEEAQLVETLEFPLAAAELIKQETGGALEQVVRNDWDAGDTPGRGLSVRLSNEAVEKFVETQQSMMLLLGCRAFWSLRRKPNGLGDGDELVVLPTTDMMEIIRLRQSDGANYGVSTDDIIARIEYWRTQCDLSVVGAAHDWVAMRFETLPENICIFAEDVYQFCPDTVDQGVGLMADDDSEALAAARALCPDVRLKFTTQDDVAAKTSAGSFEEMLQKLQGVIQEAAYTPEVKAMLSAAASEAARNPGPSQEDGVKLLAYEIQRSKYLFLWWD